MKIFAKQRPDHLLPAADMPLVDGAGGGGHGGVWVAVPWQVSWEIAHLAVLGTH